MPKCKLFDSKTFRMTLPEPFDDPSYSGAKNYGTSAYNTVSGTKKSTLHAPALRALLAYAKLVTAAEAGQDVTDLGAVGQQGSTFTVAEYRSADKTDCVVFNQTTGKFIATRIQNGTRTMVPMSLNDPAFSGSSLLFALMPTLEKDLEFQENFKQFCDALNGGWSDMVVAEEHALILCDNIYRRIEAAQVLGSAGVKVAIPATGNVSALNQISFDAGTYNPTATLYGEFQIFGMAGSGSSGPNAIAHQDFVGKYPLSQRILTQREEAMVPKLPDWYIIPHEVVRVCEHAKATTESAQPMRNFLFRGNAGTGKTMGAQAIAAGLHLPYTLMTCSANTEITDLVGQFIPDTTGFAPTQEAEGELPKISDIIMHPPSVFKQLTGIYDEAKTEDDVLQKLIEIAVGRLQTKEEGPGQRIRYVDTPLMEAIRYGYVCELQEPSCIANPGVLVGLNSLLDNCQTITLPTGERVQRHPDTVIIVTTNSDYSGCRDINQSVISRMDLVFDIEAPSLDTMAQRVMNITGFKDEAMALKMALVVQDMGERCRQTMITDGSCGMRELKSWVLSTMVTNDPYESAMSTIIGSASSDPDNRAELISTCLDAQFSRK